jgi:hypothetical protein
MSDIDPVEFGMLAQQVTTLERQVTDLQADVKELLAMANKSKGGLFIGMMISSALGGVVTWLAGHFVFK